MAPLIASFVAEEELFLPIDLKCALFSLRLIRSFAAELTGITSQLLR